MRKPGNYETSQQGYESVMLLPQGRKRDMQAD